MKNGHGRPAAPILLRQILNQLPHFCCFCHRKTDTRRDLCKYCQQHLPQINENVLENESTLCLRCGWQWPGAQVLQTCARCDNYQTAISQIISPFRYGFPIDNLIGRLKYHQHLATGRLLGSLMAESVQAVIKPDQFPDVLLPVPLNKQRYSERGFNQAVEIALGCGAVLGIPVLADAAGRHFDTGSLAGLTRADRGVRIRGAFWVSEQLRSRRVAIVDDVLTTGATSGELATELSDSGVSECQLWVVARTPVTGKDGAS